MQNISEKVDFFIEDHKEPKTLKVVMKQPDKEVRDEKEIKKKIKEIQINYKKYADSVYDLYQIYPKKEFYDLIAFISMCDNKVENLN